MWIIKVNQLCTLLCSFFTIFTSKCVPLSLNYLNFLKKCLDVALSNEKQISNKNKCLWKHKVIFSGSKMYGSVIYCFSFKDYTLN